MSAQAKAGVPMRGLAKAGRWAAAALLLLAAGCSRVKDLPPVPDESDQAYRLGVRDQVRVLTFGEDSLSDIFRVNDAGICEKLTIA